MVAELIQGPAVAAVLANQRPTRLPDERFWVRDFDVADAGYPEGYELRSIDEGPFTREAAQSLAALLNGRPRESGVEFRVCEGRSKWNRSDD